MRHLNRKWFLKDGESITCKKDFIESVYGQKNKLFTKGEIYKVYSDHIVHIYIICDDNREIAFSPIERE